MTTRRKTVCGALLLAAVACGIHLPAIDAGFFSDDYQWLGRMNATLERPFYVFTVFFRDFNPVLHASFALDWILGGDSASIWHMDSILMHGIATVLHEAGHMLVVGAGAGGRAPLVFVVNGSPYRGFLEGTVDGASFRLVLHLSNLEIKSLPKENADV